MEADAREDALAPLDVRVVICLELARPVAGHLVLALCRLGARF